MEAEFDEQELMFPPEEEEHLEDLESSGSDEEVPLAESVANAEAGVDIVQGPSSKSASIQSSTLRASLDELHDADPDAGALCSERPRIGFPVAASLPARTSAIQMGSSVPIAIPNLSRWKSPSDAPAPAGPGAKAAAAPGADPRGAAPHAAGGFVPPHKLTRQEDFTFSFNGASPSGCLKRERLRARNAILRSTGFLEPKEGGGGAGGGGGVAHSLPVAHGGGMMLRFEQHRQQQQQAQQLKGVHPPSSLTAALSTIGEGL